MATDSLSQGTRPYSREGTSLMRQFDTDLVTLVSNDLRIGNPELRTIFNFRGYALGDLALATLAYRAAAERKIGMLIPK